MAATLSIFQVDAFTSETFSGNLAAVVLLKEWLDNHLLQKIAIENNLSETAFLVKSSGEKSDYSIRWFTPEAEVSLCGHATLASAFILFEYAKNFSSQSIRFSTKESGTLIVSSSVSSLFESIRDFFCHFYLTQISKIGFLKWVGGKFFLSHPVNILLKL